MHNTSTTYEAVMSEVRAAKRHASDRVPTLVTGATKLMAHYYRAKESDPARAEEYLARAKDLVTTAAVYNPTDTRAVELLYEIATEEGETWDF